MQLWTSVREVLAFALAEGLQTAIKVVGGGLSGLVLGSLLLLVAWRLLDRLLRRPPFVGARQIWRPFLLISWALLVPALLAFAGVLVGLAAALSSTVRSEAVLQQAGELSFSAALATLRPAASRAGEYNDEIQLGIELLEGARTYAIVEVEQIIDRLSGGALDGARAFLEGEPEQGETGSGITGLVAKRAAIRLLEGVIDSQRRQGNSWLAPVIADLEHADAVDDADGRVHGRQILLTIARHHVMPPISRSMFWAFALNAALPIAVALFLLVLPFPFVLGLLLTHRRARHAPGS